MPDGYCHICGKFGPLTFEHVPPQSAFNDRPVLLMELEKIWREGLDADPDGRVQQQGAGGHTLCGRCNSNTGGWYARAFGEWCAGEWEILRRTGGSTGYLIDTHDMFPLRVLKQIVTMFFSINSPTLANRYPDLVQFVLNKEQQYLDPRYSVATYFCPPGGTRHLPLVTQFDIFRRRASYFTEITFFPFGYVLTIDSSRWDDRWFDITHFARYRYREQRRVWMRLPVLATHLPIPGDYRSEEQIRRQMERDAA